VDPFGAGRAAEHNYKRAKELYARGEARGDVEAAEASRLVALLTGLSR
jgi:hypothetical protein